MIPDDVTVQVLTQAREHIIKRTFEAVKGAKHAVIHLYNSTSVAQREQVFKKSKDEIKKIAVDGAELLQKLANEVEGNFSFEYSPESFSGTEMDYALEVCNAVLDTFETSFAGYLGYCQLTCFCLKMPCHMFLQLRLNICIRI